MLKWFKVKLDKITGIDELTKRVIRQDMEINRLNSMIRVSVDYHRGNGDASWAVICLPGQKMDYVTFVELDRNEIEEVQRFLKHFRKYQINPTIDRMPNMPKALFF